MPDSPTFAAQMLAKIEALLLANPGAQSVTFDGSSVSFADLMARRDQLRKEVAQELGQRPRFRQVDLGSF